MTVRPDAFIRVCLLMLGSLLVWSVLATGPKEPSALAQDSGIAPGWLLTPPPATPAPAAATALTRRCPRGGTIGDGAITEVVRHGGYDEYVLPSGLVPDRLASGADGAVWLTDPMHQQVSYLTPAGLLRGISLVPGSEESCYSSPSSMTGLVMNPDGALWMAVGSEGLLRLNPDASTSPIRLRGTEPSATGVAIGPDGAMWVANSGRNSIDRVDSDGTVRQLTLPVERSRPSRIIAGPDGALWFTEANAPRIGRLTVDGVITEYPLPSFTRTPYDLTIGPDGAIWFTESTELIGRLTPEGTLTEYSIADLRAGPGRGIVSAGGSIWFAESARMGLGRLDVDGTVTEVLSSRDLPITGLGVATDGAIWFTITNQRAQYGGGASPSDGRSAVGRLAP